MGQEQNFDDGRWTASTLGFFIGLLVDTGQDPAVCFRVVEDSEPDEKGRFIRHYDLLTLPNGYVYKGISQCYGPQGKTRIHKVLRAFLDEGVIK